ncbi:hypothetical protein Slin15195_G000390 [Septoria linicola]|uniref:Uncharacterized protein n=1 Tax=Septoria linicola TaxID=215465 RepID=A0A9Q9AHY2_9PEZI|nr:hypothetical protein Slin15195_G000390 [Septoria linicola]
MVNLLSAAYIAAVVPRIALAVNFADWAPTNDVPTQLKPFLQALIDAAEDPAVITGYTDYFTPDGRQTTLATDCQGAARIQACKEGFLKDNRRIVHYPNTTSIFSNSETETAIAHSNTIGRNTL